MKKTIAVVAFVEACLLCASFYVGSYLRFSGDLSLAAESMGSLLPRAIVFTIVAMLCLLSVGLYRVRQSSRFIETSVRLITAFTLAALADSALYYLVPTVSTWRGPQLLALCAALLALLSTRAVFYALADISRLKRNVLIYGRGQMAASLTQLCSTLEHQSFQILGYLGVPDEKAQETCKPVLSDKRPLLGLVRELQVDEIVVAMDNRRNCFPTRALLDCRFNGIAISEATTFAEKETGRISLSALHPSWLIYGDGFRQGTVHKLYKRIFDLSASLALLTVALPLLLVAVAAMLLESGGRGRVLLRQERVGLQGRTFEMLKLRSMIDAAESDGRARWASANDPRVTRVGAVLRRFRIDELPQILNVLKGEMSFVGPRPERPEFVRDLSAQIPFYCERHCIKPGLTGWAQLCYPYGSSIEDARQKLQYDLFYVKNHNPMLDLLILFETLEVVIWARSRSSQPRPEAQSEHAAKRSAA